jgi:ABC-type multidrug transport system fused ATPase/permease subunit
MVFVSLLTGAQAFLVKPAFDGVFLKKEGIPPFLKNMIIQLRLGDLLLKEDMEMLILLPIAIILLFSLKGIFNFGQAYLMNFVGLRIVADLREKLYNHLQNLSLSFFTKTPTGILISRITNDVNLIQGSVSNAVTGLIKDIFTIFGLIGVVFLREIGSWPSSPSSFSQSPFSPLKNLERGFGNIVGRVYNESARLRPFSTRPSQVIELSKPSIWKSMRNDVSLRRMNVISKLTSNGSKSGHFPIP